MSDLQEIEIGIETAREVVARKASLIKLENNREFKKLITNGLFKEEASRLTLLCADPRLKPEDRQEALDTLQSISRFHQYLLSIVMQGTIAENSIRDFEEARDDIEEYGEDY